MGKQSQLVLLLLVLAISLHRNVLANPGIQRFYLLKDSLKTMTPGEVLTAFNHGRFQPLTTLHVNPGYTTSVYWLAVELPAAITADSLVLSVGSQHINTVHFYSVVDRKPALLWVTGDYFPFKQRPLPTTLFSFPVNHQGLYLVRVDKSGEALQLWFKIMGTSEALANDTHNKLILFVFSGMIAMLLVFGVYLLAITREKIYLLYVLYMLCGWLYVLAHAGLGFEFLWPNAPWFASKSRPLFIMLTIFLSIFFLINYLGGIKNRVAETFIKIANFLLTLFIIIILSNTAAIKAWNSTVWQFTYTLNTWVPLFYIGITFWVLISAFIRGNRMALFYMAAISMLFVLSIAQVLYQRGAIDGHSNFLGYYGAAAGFVIEMVILTAGLVYRFNQYRLEKEGLLLKMNRQQKEAAQAMMELQEAERSQIASQLHDVAGSLLSAARLNLGTISKNALTHRADAGHLEKAEQAIAEVADMVRNLSHALSPISLQKAGLAKTLEKIVNIFNIPGKIHIRLLLTGVGHYPAGNAASQLSLYSIIYELLNNVVKHSFAKNVLLQVTETEESLLVIMEDDGIGLHAAAMEGSGALGLWGIEAKTRLLNGTLSFDQNIPSGLIVSIEIPKTTDEETSHFTGRRSPVFN